MSDTSPRMALRLDDVGASSKKYEVYSNRVWHLNGLTISANWLFLKRLPPFRAWGPYREMRVAEWAAVFELLRQHEAKLTVAITAAWVESVHRLIPFPERFPEQAALLREGLEEGLLEIANHGLTHCVLEDNAFKPKWFESNRRFHREFWEWVPPAVQEEHIARSQHILQDWFKVDIVTFVPPGNVYTAQTLEIAGRYGLKYLSSKPKAGVKSPLREVDEEQVIAFHDREMVLLGVDWLREAIESSLAAQLCTVRELGETLSTAPSVQKQSVKG